MRKFFDIKFKKPELLDLRQGSVKESAHLTPLAAEKISEIPLPKVYEKPKRERKKLEFSKPFLWALGLSFVLAIAVLLVLRIDFSKQTSRANTNVSKTANPQVLELEKEIDNFQNSFSSLKDSGVELSLPEFDYETNF